MKDFTQGNIFKKMVIFSGPILLTNLLQASYQFIDSLWVGNLLGAEALGAVSVSSVVVFTILSFMIGMNRASLTILSQQKGRKDESGLKESINSFASILTILAVLFGLVGYLFSGMILRGLQTPETIFELATTYLQINFMGIVFLFGYNFIGTILRGLGDSKTPVIFVTIAVVLNTILDPLFIATFDLGVAGAAYATIFSQGSALLFGILYSIINKKIPFMKPHWPNKLHMRTILKLGIPSGLQMMVISGGVMAIMSVVTVFGDKVVAGFGAAQRIDSLIMLPAFALSSAVTTMAGQNIGVKEWGRVSKIAGIAVASIFFVMMLISLGAFLFAEQLVGLFVSDPGTIKFGGDYLRMIAFFYPFLGINFVLNGVVRASGAMMQVLMLNIISFWVLRYPLTKLCAGLFGQSGIALGMGISLIVSSLLSFLYFRFGKWRQIRLFETGGS